MASIGLTGWYILKTNKKVKFHLGYKLWDTIFPDSILKLREPKKFEEVFIPRKMSNPRYVEYLLGNINHGSNTPFDTKYFTEIMHKIEKWCGKDPIIVVSFTYDHFKYILTDSIVPGDRVGIVNHYFDKIRIRFNKALKKRKLYRLMNQNNRLMNPTKEIHISHTEGVVGTWAEAGTRVHAEGPWSKMITKEPEYKKQHWLKRGIQWIVIKFGRAKNQKATF